MMRCRSLLGQARKRSFGPEFESEFACMEEKLASLDTGAVSNEGIADEECSSMANMTAALLRRKKLYKGSSLIVILAYVTESRCNFAT